MYQFSYDEAIEDDQAEARSAERQALDQAIGLLQAADSAGLNTRATVEALYYTRRLWNAFVGELASEENALPVEVRANLISIGIWILKEADSVQLGKSRNCAAIGEICAIVRDGLL
ncbi:flagellar biosynthesis regulator FlaF [Beijerinckia sp. L45]|jgi:flagellar protein FlaF|uniref:flagellar biosynthesis regulator FlaF n=1 Tax=Beijerinckia sp. L45 TaxID=1641855 RepID=UPI00131BD299|nr:flagellar biosynthesis regulator FlaF [Beijerinckia sp. L45]